MTCKTSIAVELTDCCESQDKLFFKDESYYEGKFVNGDIMGNGFKYWALTGAPVTITYPLKKPNVAPERNFSCFCLFLYRNTYSGQFVFGKLHGHEILQYKEGGKYEGELFYGMREELRAIKIWIEDHYEGAWILDKCQGHGILPCAVGTVYEGQWRNDIFNERGTIVNCSGDICDGLINGYPADYYKDIFEERKFVPLLFIGLWKFWKKPWWSRRFCAVHEEDHSGIDTLTAAHGGPHTKWIFPEGTAAHRKPTPGARSPDRNCCSWRTYAGAGEKSANSRGLEIWAGIRNHHIPSSSATNLFELIEETERRTGNSCKLSFDICCIWELKSTVSVISNSGFALADLPIPKGEESESGSDTLYGAGDSFISQHVRFETLELTKSYSVSITLEDVTLSLEPLIATKGFKKKPQNTAGHKGGKKPSGRISAEKAEKMTVSQEKMEDSSATFHKNEGFSVLKRTEVYHHIFPGFGQGDASVKKDSPTADPVGDDTGGSHMASKEYKLQKDQHLIKNSKTLQGQYVLMVHEVTMPPFLGQPLPPAFKLLIFPEKTKTKNKDSFKVTSK
ncbi:LOW QUALITY PROTEIN: MORN repeat-containing protein 1 [Ciconia maguari]